METDRRGFLRWLGGALTVASNGAAAGDRGLEIHAQTANTRWGALGVRLRALQDPLAPFKSYPNAKRFDLPAVDAWRDVVRAMFAAATRGARR